MRGKRFQGKEKSIVRKFVLKFWWIFFAGFGKKSIGLCGLIIFWLSGKMYNSGRIFNWTDAKGYRPGHCKLDPAYSVFVK